MVKTWILRVSRITPFYMEASVEYLMLFFGPTFLYHETFFTLILLFWKCSTKNVVLNTQLLLLLVLQEDKYSSSLPFAVKTNAWVFIYHYVLLLFGEYLPPAPLPP